MLARYAGDVDLVLYQHNNSPGTVSTSSPNSTGSELLGAGAGSEGPGAPLDACICGKGRGEQGNCIWCLHGFNPWVVPEAATPRGQEPT